jgi:signal peptidase I
LRLVAKVVASVAVFTLVMTSDSISASSRPVRPGSAAPRIVLYRVPSPAMLPTLKVGSLVKIDLNAYRSRNPAIGDIVVFHPPAGADPANPVCGAPLEGAGAKRMCGTPVAQASAQTFIKRILARPGDRISMKNGHLIRNGKREHRHYFWACSYPDCNFPRTVVVPTGDYFTLGDNRGESDDSRFWGPVRKAWILGRVISHTR